LRQRVGDGARALGEFGDDIVNRPGALPGKAHGWFRTWFGKIWRVRGGGLYALGYATCFAYLEAKSFVSGFAGSESLVDFVTDEILEFLFRFLGDSLLNFVLAFLWPVYVLQYSPPIGPIAFVAAIVLFPLLLKKPIERWLFGDAAPDLPGDDSN
jgi:hypothetical protein